MESKNKVLEALQMQPLSEEEKQSRHILGRLWGPIATTKEKTRNGRGYNAELWNRALADEIFCEKVANKSLFLELGHPVDREETDMNVVCACIPELPKIVDGDLYAYVDILDTKQGRLLKTLCDYGFVPGISSRGSGDIMANNDVDPETFFLETWDIVQLPAVKKARLTMCESLNNKKSLSAALRESLETMSEEDRLEAEETLERLEVDVNDSEEEPYPEIPWAPGEEPLTEDAEDETPEGEFSEEEVEDEAEVEVAETEEVEEIPTADEAEEESEDEAITIGDFIDSFAEFDENLAIEFDSIELDDNILTITDIVLDDTEEGKIKVSFNYNLETSDNKESEEESEEEVPEEVENSEDTDDAEEAIDDGEEEVIESLKDVVRQKDALEEEVLDLKNKQAVSDAEVGKLKEELNKYRTGFMRVSGIAPKANEYQKEAKALTEQLAAKDSTISELTAKVKKHPLLTESIDNSKRRLAETRERLAAVQNEAEETEKKLTEQLEETRKKVQERTKVAEAYKSRYEAAAKHYIASKASMLGVNTRDITSQLKEGYTFEDVDRICENLLDAGRPAFGFGMKPQKSVKAQIKESVNTSDDDGFEDLLILAGLK